MSVAAASTVVVVQDVVAPAVIEAAGGEVEWAVCACCGLREECTTAYAAGVRARYAGRWLCGLCGDAVGEELAVCTAHGLLEDVEAAVARHAAFCRALTCRSPAAAERLIAAVRRLLRSSGSGKREEAAAAAAMVVLEFHET